MTRVCTLLLLFSIVLEILAIEVSWEKKMKGIQKLKENEKLAIFADKLVS